MTHHLGVKGDLQNGAFPDGCHQSPHPCGGPLLTHTPTGDPPTLAGSFGSVSCGITAPFLWVLVHTRFCLCPPRQESLFPPTLWKYYNQIPLAFKVGFPEDSQSLCQVPRLGSLMSGSKHSQKWENFFGTIGLQFVSPPPSGCGIWFYCDCASPTISVQLLLCRWTWGIFFGRFQDPPVDGCSIASCDFGALAVGDEHISFYSSILNQKSLDGFNDILWHFIFCCIFKDAKCFHDFITSY